ncbi:MAG: A24 family peptidase [Oscillospiraceae bacterium]
MLANSILKGALFCSLLLVTSYVDIKKRMIPNRLCLLIAMTGLINFSPVNLFGIFVALPFLIAAMSKENSIGGGDIKLTATVGIVLGFWNGMYGIIIALSILLLFYIILIAAAKVRKKQVGKNLSMPLAPFLGIGFTAIYFINLGGNNL